MITIKDDQYILDFSHSVPVDSALGWEITEMIRLGKLLNDQLVHVPESEGFIKTMISNQALFMVDA